MHWPFGKAAGPKHLGPDLMAELANRHFVPRECLARLMYVEREVQHEGRKVRQVRVYDPERLTGEGSAVTVWDGLPPGAVLFQGRIEANGPRLRDLRRGLLDPRRPAGRAAPVAARKVRSEAGYQEGFTPD